MYVGLKFLAAGAMRIMCAEKIKAVLGMLRLSIGR